MQFYNFCHWIPIYLPYPPLVTCCLFEKSPWALRPSCESWLSNFDCIISGKTRCEDFSPLMWSLYRRFVFVSFIPGPLGSWDHSGLLTMLHFYIFLFGKVLYNAILTCKSYWSHFDQFYFPTFIHKSSKLNGVFFTANSQWHGCILCIMWHHKPTPQEGFHTWHIRLCNKAFYWTFLWMGLLEEGGQSIGIWF